MECAASSEGPLDARLAQLVVKFARYLNFPWRIEYAHLVLGNLEFKFEVQRSSFLFSFT
jgi:hypothetical protein